MQVDFYVLPEAGGEVRERFCCRLAERAWQKGVPVFVRVPDEAAAERLDQRLWTFRPGSFVPHARSREADGEPVVIGPAPPDGATGLLINLGDDLVDGWQSWPRVAEILSADEPVRRRGRERFRAYRSAGIEPDSHPMQGA